MPSGRPNYLDWNDQRPQRRLQASWSMVNAAHDTFDRRSRNRGCRKRRAAAAHLSSDWVQTSAHHPLHRSRDCRV